MRKTVIWILTLVLFTLSCPVGATEMEAALQLGEYGIMRGDPDGNYRLSDSISRAEFSKMIMIARNGAVCVPQETVFSDVDASHWASGYIASAAEHGIINGLGDGTFAPGSPVTHSQALKMVLHVLGYGQQAEDLGGYPDGYYAVLDTVQLMPDFPRDAEGATRGEIALLLVAALDVPLRRERKIFYFGEDGRLTSRTEVTVPDGQAATLRTALAASR
ncbi:MAG: S-layer homology domain-containing protein [Ruminococcaceae bacterium]|nr:S-layer homology domain-containing protein [Oscillospiraceae bacterium]